MPGDAAKATMENLQMRIAWTPFELEQSGTKINLHSIAGVAALNHTSIEQDDLASRAKRALHLAGTNGYSPTYLITEEKTNQYEQPIVS
jgi:PleD family two-component response regulator